MSSTCCGVVPLRSTCFLIAYLSAIGCFAVTVYCLVMLSLSGLVMNKAKDPYDAHLGQLYFIYYCVIAATTAVGFILSTMLVVGLHTNKRKYAATYVGFLVGLIGVSLYYFIRDLVGKGGFRERMDYYYAGAILVAIICIIFIATWGTHGDDNDDDDDDDDD